MKMSNVKAFFATVIPVVAVVVGVLFAGWLLLAGLVWVISSPVQNLDMCAAEAKSRGVDNYTYSGWRNDTCYIYFEDGKREVIKL